MVTIKPFRGLRYSADHVDLSQVLSQPYDRVRYGLQERYYALNPYNVVRIIKGREQPGDAPDREEGPNVYTRARAYYDRWQVEGVLCREAHCALYVYHQSFAVRGVHRTRRGFVAAFALSPFEEGIVLPHERTHAGPKVDRLRLLRALEANVGQVFMLYPDPSHQVTALLDAAIADRAPDVDAREVHEREVQQQLWAVTAEDTIRAIQRELADKRHLIIADGHHRYETALAYRDEMRARHPGAPPDAAFNYRMVTLVSMDDPGLVVLPTHREVFDYPDVPPAEVLARAEQVFELIPAADLEACLAGMRRRADAHAFGLYGERRYHILVLKDPASIAQWIPGPQSLEWKSLDVSIAHKILLEQLVGLPADAADRGEGTHIRYHREPGLAIENVDAGRGNWVLLLNPTRIEQVGACAETGCKMPQKSTDFYPKMVSGLTVMPVPADQRI